MAKLLKICMVVANNLDYDTRVLNEAHTLARDFNLTIITTGCFNQRILKNSAYQVKYPKMLSINFKDLERVINLLPLMFKTFSENPDIYHAHDLPGLAVAWPSAILKRKILVYDSHELWSEVTLFRRWKIFLTFFRFLEKILLYKVKAIITVNQSLAQILKKRYHKQVLALYNYSVTRHLQPACQRRYHLNLAKFGRQKIILYLGAFQAGRGLDQIIKAATYLDSTYHILLIGYGPDRKKLSQIIKIKKLQKKISLLPPLPPDQIIAVIRQAQLGLCLIENVSLSYYYSTPNKIFQYMAAKLPILASNFPEQKKIVLQNKIGEVVDPRDPQVIAQKIVQMTQEVNWRRYRKNLEGLKQKKYTWEKEAKKLLSFYKNIIKNDQ